MAGKVSAGMKRQTNNSLFEKTLSLKVKNVVEQ